MSQLLQLLSLPERKKYFIEKRNGLDKDYGVINTAILKRR